jgi:hypothetical protein
VEVEVDTGVYTAAEDTVVDTAEVEAEVELPVSPPQTSLSYNRYS